MADASESVVDPLNEEVSMRRPPPHSARVLLVLVAAALAGCQDLASPIRGSTSAADEVLTPSVPQGTDIPTLDRYGVQVRTEGPIRVGVPIRIVVEGVANLPSPGTELSVTLPEVELAKMAGRAEEFSYRLGTVVPAAVRQTVPSVARAGRLQRSFTVEVPAPGYYRVVATMRATEDVPQRVAGHWVRNAASSEMWLLVTDSGGRVLPEFEPSLVPDGMVPNPGPFRRLADTERTGSIDGREATALSGQITWRVRYYNQNTFSYQAVPGAVYSLYTCSRSPNQFICNEEDFSYADGGSTDPSGYIYLSCDGDEYELNVSTYAGSVRFQIVNGGNAVKSDVPADCGGSYEMVLPSSQVHLFQQMNKVWEGAATHFGATRPFFSVEVVSGGGSYYSPSDDRVRIDVGDIWGDDQWLAFTAGHEYGHAFHEKALGGNVAGGSCPAPHYLDTESNLQCAYSEGFANYSAVAVRPDLSTFGYRAVIEADNYFPGCTQRQSSYPYSCVGTSYEGSVIEGAFAAFLYDLTDTAVESHDAISGPGSYIRDLIISCNVEYFAIVRRANGTDELTYCAENAINPSGRFTRRGAYPSAYVESAAEPATWTTAGARSSWVWNMYDKR